MPHHIAAVTRGAEAIEARMPAGWRLPKAKARRGLVAAWAAREAAAAEQRRGGRAGERRCWKRGPRTARPQTAR